MTSKRRWGFLVGLVLACLLLDQATKTWVVSSLTMYESFQPIPALYPVFQITRSFNTGAAFGMFAGAPWTMGVFLAVAVGVSILLIWSYRNLTDADWMARVASGLVIGGALGNALDRLIYGHVVDFIHYTVPGVISNVSNLADHAIVGGVLLMIIASWREDPDAADTPEEAFSE